MSKQSSLKFYLLGLLLVLATYSANADDTPLFSLNHDDFIRFHWKGGLTSHSLTVKAAALDTYNTTTTSSYPYAYIAVYIKDATGNITGINVTSFTFSTASPYNATIALDNLTPASNYTYSFVFTNNATLDKDGFYANYTNYTGTKTEFGFYTHNLALSAYNFTFGFACCAQTNSTSNVFSNLLSENLTFFVHTGNMHYADITQNDVSQYYDAYYNVFTSTAQETFFQSVPIVYVWDDNDYGAANSTGNAATRPAATTAFKTIVPYVSLKEKYPSDDNSLNGNPAVSVASSTSSADEATFNPTEDEYGIYRSFIVGRCLFIVMDLRSFRDIKSGDILGDNQLNWLKNQLIFASVNSGILQVFLVSNLPWIDTASSTEWINYNSTQSKIATYVNTYITGTKKLMMLSGNVGMLAFDAGYNNAKGAFAVAHAGALDNDGSCAGGPYTNGLGTGRGQYGTIQVTDNGTVVCVYVALKRLGTNVIRYNTCNPSQYIAQQATCPTNNLLDKVVGSSSWAVFIIVAVAIVLVALILLWKAFQMWRQRKTNETAINDAEAVAAESYVELPETSIRKQKLSKGKDEKEEPLI